MTAHEPFVILLQRILEQRSVSASELARRLRINRSTTNRWVNGEVFPDRDAVRRIADALMLTGAERRVFLLLWMGEGE
jgi:transcriptional regulator with XRE-family HTH domain